MTFDRNHVALLVPETRLTKRIFIAMVWGQVRRTVAMFAGVGHAVSRFNPNEMVFECGLAITLAPGKFSTRLLHA